MSVRPRTTTTARTDGAPPLRLGQDDAPPTMRVSVADRNATRKAGVSGLLMSLGGADGGPVAGPVEVEVDYNAFRHAYGGDYAARLRLVELPACALTTPDAARCRVQKPLKTRNDLRSGTLSAEVRRPSGPVSAASGGPAGVSARTASSATVLAATASAEGPTGDFKATSLQPSGSWSAGDSTGSFSWSYPIDVPGVPSDLKPSVALQYDSQSVDGLTAASNSQASWIGDGWNWQPGFIERRYKACDDDKTNGTNTTRVGDLCWFNDNAVLNLGGKSTELVFEAGKGWHPAADSGETVEKLTGAANGDGGSDGVDGKGEHWKVTTTDGTQYFFGRNRLPGWKDNGTAADDPVTNSTWTVPVFGNQT
ncbi:hypothetical protein ACIP8Z_26315, partial [Streptomyces sp. NPDC088553]